MRAIGQAFVALLTVLACGSGEGSGAAAAVRDSAGITIVENRRPTWRAETAWHLSDRPVLQIGVEEGDPAYVLARVAGAIRLPDGRVLVGDGGSNQLRFFDSAGTFLAAVGRSGQGPGEFQFLRDVRRCEPDVITAFDLNWQRSWFDLDGRFRDRAQLVTPEGVSPYALSCSVGDRYLVTGWGNTMVVAALYRTTAPLVVIDGTGNILHRLDSVPGSERVGTERGSRPHPFGRSTHVLLRGDTAIIGTADDYSLAFRHVDGTLVRIVRRVDVRLTDTAGLRATYRRARLASASNVPAVERELDAMVFPPSLPAYDLLRSDPTGHLWVRAFAPLGVEARAWSVFAPAGQWLGDVAMPARFTVTEIGADYVIGVHRNELDVEFVHLYRLIRPREVP
ncbi:MAG TPA: 6-bladed beta-propeller [Gemmatimonadales bacterium]